MDSLLKSFITLALLIAQALVVVSANATNPSVAQNLIANTVSVDGQAYVDVEPDIVRLEVYFTALKSDLQSAKKTVDKSYMQALAITEKFGIDKKDLKLTMLNSRPEYEWQDRQRIFKGQRVSRSLSITIRDLDIYPELLQALVDSSIAEIRNVSAEISQPNKYKNQALKKAVVVATQKAELLASEFGRTLGQVLQIHEGQSQTSRPIVYSRQASPMMADAAESSLPQASFGTQRVYAKVSTVFELK
jgi:uncharacterized protein YggE